MSVIPLVTTGEKATIVTTPEAFEAAGASEGHAALIREFDEKQPFKDASNVSYDLRVGREYRDHRNEGAQKLAKNGGITLFPGGAVIIETQETIRLPRSMFGYVVPRVFWLQKGISNTMSKVDPGYDGHLLVTLFNLGKSTGRIKAGDRFCTLVLHQVAEGARLYNKPAKRIEGDASAHMWQRVRDRLEANTAVIIVIVILLQLLVLLFQFAPLAMSLWNRMRQ